MTDCDAYGRLTRQYSVSELDTALAQIPTAVQEYTNCYAIIQDALLAEVPGSRLGGGGASQSSSSPFLPLPVIIVLAVLVASGAGSWRRRTAAALGGGIDLAKPTPPRKRAGRQDTLLDRLSKPSTRGVHYEPLS